MSVVKSKRGEGQLLVITKAMFQFPIDCDRQGGNETPPGENLSRA